MADEPEILDGPDPELAPAVDEALPEVSADIVVRDPQDEQQLMRAMDEHDVQMLLQEIQKKALHRWVYKFVDGSGGEKLGLTVHAVQDIVQRMNWTGKARIGLLPETLVVETVTQDVGKGEERFYEATVFARDEVTGMSQSGTSMEPHNMRLRNGKTKYDLFARTKAINKAERNAMAKFIPEEIEQTVLAGFSHDPSRVQMIQTEAEAKLAELPPPLDDEEALGLIAAAEKAYAEIVWPPARVEFPSGKFAAYKLTAQHSHDRLRDLLAFVESERDRLREKYGSGS